MADAILHLLARLPSLGFRIGPDLARYKLFVGFARRFSCLICFICRTDFCASTRTRLARSAVNNQINAVLHSRRKFPRYCECPANGSRRRRTRTVHARIRDELRTVLASEAFKGGKRAQDFLRLVVEHALAGRLDNLRERMLGVEMFGRPVDYDTANDAVVRVKASEVRRRLAQYYGSLEVPPAVRIDLPPGSYVPQFSFETTPPARWIPQWEPNQRSWRQRLRLQPGIPGSGCLARSLC